SDGRPRPSFLRAARRGPNSQPGRLRYGGPASGLTHSGSCWHIVRVMGITIQLDLPEALAKEAKATGLLESESMTDLLTTELRRRRAAAELKDVLEGIRAQPGEPMSEADIAAEIKEARKERRARETGR